jgi:alkanesulfonate monooxygenase SsuD/methylene tetrahydromethanopterin reductase-like flavin-dependent oxidoreductase (luciferase family)
MPLRQCAIMAFTDVPVAVGWLLAVSERTFRRWRGRHRLQHVAHQDCGSCAADARMERAIQAIGRRTIAPGHEISPASHRPPNLRQRIMLVRLQGRGFSANFQAQSAGRTQHGLVYTKPRTRTCETVTVVRDLVRDGRVSFKGETIQIDNFDLWYTPRHRDVPVYLSAVFQKGIELCGAVADRVILTRSTLRTAAEVRAHLAEGARKAGRDPRSIAVTTLLPTSVGDTRAVALSALRPGIAFYCGFFPRYNRMMFEHGFATEAREIAASWAHDDREPAERAVSDEMINATSVSGTPEQCRARIEAYRRSGIDMPIIIPFARGADARTRFEAAIRACAPAAQ